jgi:pyridoxamine 5'-phosphate oxidase
MNIQNCIEFASNNAICYVATIENNKPRVRALGLWFADQTGFYFQTSTIKEIPHQLELNPNIEICFYKHEGIIGTQLRISGEVEFLTDIALKERVLQDRPFLKAFGVTAESKELSIFRIAHGEAHFWTMENNLKPKEIITF